MADDLVSVLVRMREKRRFIADNKDAAQAVEGVGTAAEKAARQGEQAANKWSTLSKRQVADLQKVGKGMTTWITLPVLAAGALSLRSAGNFEQSMNVFQETAHASEKQMRAVSAAAKALGKDATLPGTSAADAAESMLELSKAGLSVEQSMDAARGALQFAAAEQISNAEAAQYVGTALSTFSLKGDQATRVADLLAAAGSAASGTATEMAQALQQAGSVASLANVPIEDTVTALALMAKNGILGSDAGTSLKSMLMRLTGPVGAGRKALAKYNVELRDQQGNLKDLPVLATEFQKKLGTLGKAQRDAALTAIFGSDGIRAANTILFREGAAGFEAMSGKTNQQGRAAQLAAARMKGFNGALDNFKSQAETAAITLGEQFLPTATKAVKTVSRGVEIFGDLPGPVQKGVIAVAALAAVTGPLVLVTAKMITAYRTVKSVFVASTVATSAQTAATTAQTVATGELTVAQRVLNFVMKMNPVLRVVAAVVLLAGILTVATGHTDDLADAARAAWGWIKGHWPLLAAIMTGPFGIAVLAIVRNFDALKRKGQAVIDWITKKVQAFWDALPGPIRAILDGSLFGGGPGATTAKQVVGSTDAGTLGGIIAGAGKPPGAAEGGIVRRAGSVLVGERGPEILSLPPAARVDPLPAGGETVQHIHVYLDGRKIYTSVVRTGRYMAARS